MGAGLLIWARGALMFWASSRASTWQDPDQAPGVQGERGELGAVRRVGGSEGSWEL